MLQIGVIQFVQKQAQKKLKSVKKNNPPWSPGTWEYVESVGSSPVLTQNTKYMEKIVSNLNSTIPDNVCLVNPNQEILQLKHNHQMKSCEYIPTVVGLGICRRRFLVKLKQTNQ